MSRKRARKTEARRLPVSQAPFNCLGATATVNQAVDNRLQGAHALYKHTANLVDHGIKPYDPTFTLVHGAHNQRECEVQTRLSNLPVRPSVVKDLGAALKIVGDVTQSPEKRVIARTELMGLVQRDVLNFSGIAMGAWEPDVTASQNTIAVSWAGVVDIEVEGSVQGGESLMWDLPLFDEMADAKMTGVTFADPITRTIGFLPNQGTGQGLGPAALVIRALPPPAPLRESDAMREALNQYRTECMGRIIGVATGPSGGGLVGVRLGQDAGGRQR